MKRIIIRLQVHPCQLDKQHGRDQRKKDTLQNIPFRLLMPLPGLKSLPGLPPAPFQPFCKVRSFLQEPFSVKQNADPCRSRRQKPDPVKPSDTESGKETDQADPAAASQKKGRAQPPYNSHLTVIVFILPFSEFPFCRPSYGISQQKQRKKPEPGHQKGQKDLMKPGSRQNSRQDPCSGYALRNPAFLPPNGKCCRPEKERAGLQDHLTAFRCKKLLPRIPL